MPEDRFRARRRPTSDAGIAGIIGAINVRLAKEVGQIHPQLVAKFEDYKAAVDVLNAAHHLVRAALNHLAVFSWSVGPQVERRSRTKMGLYLVGLAFASALEVDFAFGGLRFAIGHFGDLPHGNPLADPTALLGAIAVAIASLFLGHLAGEQLARCERGTLSDPQSPDITEDVGLPLAVTDPYGAELRGPNAIEDILIRSGEHAPAQESAGAESPGVAAQALEARYGRVFRDARRKRVRQLIAFMAIVAGCSLWACNGIMRNAYLQQVASSQTGPQITSIAVAPQVSVNPTSSTSKLSGELEPAIVVGSEVIFLLVVLVVAAAQSAVQLREEDLRRSVTRFKRDRAKELKHAMKVIKEYDELRSRLAEKRVQAFEEENIAEANSDEEDSDEPAAGSGS